MHHTRFTAPICAATLLLLASLADPASTQAPGDPRAVRLEASWLAGSVTYSTRLADGWFAGGGLGGGIDALRLVSDRDLFLGRTDQDYTELAHLVGFASWTPSPHFRTDFGLRASVIIYGDADFSGTHFIGPYVAPAVGWRRLKAGPRLQAGLVRAGGVDGVAVFFKPIVVSLTLPW
jgi:hypothetical protein